MRTKRHVSMATRLFRIVSMGFWSSFLPTANCRLRPWTVINEYRFFMIVITVFVFLLGISVGSFLNVCIWRLPRGKSIVSPSSHCPKCDHSIRWFENLPLLSWLVLQGKCSNCGEPISPRYFGVELLTGILFLLAWFRMFELHVPTEFIKPAFALYATTIMLMVTTTFIDYDHRLIPNKTTYPAIAFGLTWAAVNPEFWNTHSAFQAFSFSCASTAVFGLALATLVVVGRMIFNKDVLGWGDVKYIAAIAALLGPRAAFITIFAGSVCGALVGVTGALAKKKGLRRSIPFGPSLAVGTLIWIARGPEIVEAYWRLTRILR
ncbi:MAG: prepilin peptidase [Victivallales bacterium]|nr:prepilin peptidase [Victivallales bacterium]